MPLSEVVLLQRGFDLPAKDRRPGSFPVLTSGETGGTHDQGPVKGPGVVVGRASNLGRPKWSEGDFWPHNTTMFVKDFMGNEPRWVYHLFENTDLAGFNSGSVQPMLNRNYIARVPVMVPPASEQREIAEVLGALDRMRLANIELARATDELVSTCFTRAVREATYPGATFADVARVSGGGTPSTKVPEYWEGTIPWATPTDVTALEGPYLESTSRTITGAGLRSCSSELFSPGAILMTSRATIGAFALTQVPTAVNQGFIVVEPHDETLRYWMLHDMRSRVDEFIAMANGATFLELSRGNFKKLEVRVAARHVMQDFATNAEALHKSARHALLENHTLTELRATLLPELMSGRLRVKDAEKKIAGVM